MIHPGVLVTDPVVTPYGVPEHVFGLGPVELAGTGGRARMRTAEWMRDERGRPTAGLLGVLVDDIVGQATLSARPPDHWPVTTELSIDVVGAVPVDGSALEATSELAAADTTTAVGRGEVRAGGVLLALGTAWTRFVPGVPDLDGPRPDPGDALARAREASSVRDLLGGTFSRDGTGRAVLTVPAGPVVANAAGHGHGGVLTCAAEVTAAAAVDDPAHPLVTGGLRVTFLRPAVLDGGLAFTADVVHRGRTTSLVHVTVAGPDGCPCAVASVVGRAVAPG